DSHRACAGQAGASGGRTLCPRPRGRQGLPRRSGESRVDLARRLVPRRRPTAPRRRVCLPASAYAVAASASRDSRGRLTAPGSLSSARNHRGGAMADRKQDLLGRLADLSEEAVQRLSEAPGADRALQALKGLGDRVDDLQRRTRGFEELEGRLTALE